MKFPRLVIAGVGSGCGKTTLTCAILAALKNRDKRVISFKCGPDYIDPMFHKSAIGIESDNLDSFFCDDNLLKKLFARQAQKGEISVIEGVMGYYDGMSIASSEGSTYAVARAMSAPVVLVVNARGMAATVLAVVEGIKSYKKDSNICGVILNNTTNSVFEQLKPLLEKNGTAALGYFPKNEEIALDSRHLGLVTPDNIKDISQKLQKMAAAAEECLDLDRLTEIADKAGDIAVDIKTQKPVNKRVRVAVARDSAFCFYYPDNIALLEELGCEIAYFSPLADKALPQDIGGLLLGGGYPELYCGELSANKAMLDSIKNAVESGLPTLAECGGFMYLHNKIKADDGVYYNMVGVLDGECYRGEKLGRFGYINLYSTVPFMGLDEHKGIKAHEFHYWQSTINGTQCAAVKPNGRSWRAMAVYKGLFGGFPHLFYPSQADFAEEFVKKCCAYAKNKNNYGE